MYEPIAYAPPDAGVLLCPACAQKAAKEAGESLQEWGAMFPGEEVDAPASCDACGTIIEECALTTAGQAYVLQEIAEHADDIEPSEALRTFARIAHEHDLWLFGIGYGLPGCLYDSTSGPYTSQDDATRALIADYIDQDNDPDPVSASTIEVEQEGTDETEPIYGPGLVVFQSGAYAQTFEIDPTDAIRGA